MENNGIRETIWDQPCFGIKTYEVTNFNDEIKQFILNHPGHYSLKINPLVSKKELHDFGFYYCDTLVEPVCHQQQFIRYDHDEVTLSQADTIKEIEPFIFNIWHYSRFHRDFNISKELADRRYIQWLEQLCGQGNVYNLLFNNELAGFVACIENRLVLHALNQSYRGKGLAKFFWSSFCQHLFSQGYSELTSSISTTNMPVLNLYCSLGFNFRNPVDVYHFLQP